MKKLIIILALVLMPLAARADIILLANGSDKMLAANGTDHVLMAISTATNQNNFIQKYMLLLSLGMPQGAAAQIAIYSEVIA